MEKNGKILIIVKVWNEKRGGKIMQIRLVIGVRDARYLGNLSAYLEKSHMDKLEIVTFSSPELIKE